MVGWFRDQSVRGWTCHTSCVKAGLVPEEGTVLRIRADMRSRLVDRNHQLLGETSAAKIGEISIQPSERPQLRFEDRFAFLQGEVGG